MFFFYLIFFLNILFFYAKSRNIPKIKLTHMLIDVT
jgi:hypothetical protein